MMLFCSTNFPVCVFCSTNFPVCDTKTLVFSEKSHLTERAAVKIASVLILLKQGALSRLVNAHTREL